MQLHSVAAFRQVLVHVSSESDRLRFTTIQSFHKSATALVLQCGVYAANLFFQVQQRKGKVTVQATGKFPFEVSACFTYFEF